MYRDSAILLWISSIENKRELFFSIFKIAKANEWMHQSIL